MVARALVISRLKKGTMPTRTACTARTGSLQDGSGQVELSSSQVVTLDALET